MNEAIYNNLVNMVCELGCIPMDVIDTLCQCAHDQIIQGVKDTSTRKDRKSKRDVELFGWFKQDRSTFNAEWDTYLEENWDNMEIG